MFLLGFEKSNSSKFLQAVDTAVVAIDRNLSGRFGKDQHGQNNQESEPDLPRMFSRDIKT